MPAQAVVAGGMLKNALDNVTPGAAPTGGSKDTADLKRSKVLKSSPLAQRTLRDQARKFTNDVA